MFVAWSSMDKRLTVMGPGIHLILRNSRIMVHIFIYLSTLNEI